MQTITIQISDDDYADLQRHFARPESERIGRPMVAVVAIINQTGTVPPTVSGPTPNEEQ